MQKLAKSEQTAVYGMEAERERLEMAEFRIADVQAPETIADDLVNLPSGQSGTANGSALEFLDTGMFADDMPLSNSRNPLGRAVKALGKARERAENCRDTSAHRVLYGAHGA
ncbi:hypothetical protein CBR_g23909 [Chara braunii]|uniref:Uncharacterized protein n=1 Tax=Chara braunii TaxID=69332 RepID=A0A388L577_CHABU|nr:hypothetical protein CBR_g23909 [Chara braunii]|eukprot:GBG77461.1 hypothetical protein CBR_g23909 [Chara braunii]